MSFRAIAAASCLVVASVASAWAADRTIIVLDASGSMWGQIQGKAKIEIAREALSRVLGEFDQDRELGLMAYGHRKKGQCSDIELVVPPSAGTVGQITDAVAGIKPKGKTPLSDAVRQAAESLKFTEDKATVILLTDGLETCDADPCALGRELEELGVDFTAHVVGFGLSEEEGRQVACLADETGGLYLAAADADELNDALTQTTKAPPPPPEPVLEASLDAQAEVEITKRFDVSWDGPGEEFDLVDLYDPTALNGDGRTVKEVRLTNGNMDTRTVSFDAPSTTGSYQLRYIHAESRKVLATRSIEVVPVPVQLIAPDSVPMASMVNIEWVGPGGENDDIKIWDPNANGGDGRYFKSVRLRNQDFDNRRVELPAPAKPGVYEIHYWAGGDSKVLATRKLEVVEVPVSLETTPPHAAGDPITVMWTGPGARYDDIEMWDPSANGGEGKKLRAIRLRNDDFDNQRATLPGPAAAGTYQLRYWNGDSGLVLATLEIQVDETVVSLEAPEQIEAGQVLTVVWEGPGARYDDIVLWDPNARGGDGQKVYSKRLRNDDFENRTVTLPTPGKAGMYELQYYHGDSTTVMATRQIEVTEAVVSLDAPEQIEAARPITVSWQGPGARYDEIQMWDMAANGGDGKRLHYQRVRNADFDNKRVTLPGPAEAGTYELRYFHGDSRTVMASAQIVVTAVEVGMEARDSVGQGFVIKVKWDGPGARYDEIQLWDPDARGGEGQRVFYKRLRNDDFDNRQVTLPGPTKVGTYELRYWNGDNRKIMATRAIQITPIEMGIEGPEAVEVNTTFGVTWKGPGARYDEAQIVKAGSDKVVVRKRLRNDPGYDENKASIKAPKEPGEYILRYYNGDNRAVLAEQPLSVQ